MLPLQPPTHSQIVNTSISTPLSAYNQFRFRSEAIVAPSSIAKPTLTQEIEREYLIFQAENVIDLKSDPLHWRRERKQILFIAGSVGKESVGNFSRGRKAFLQGLTDKRNSLNGDAVTTLVW